MRRSAMKSAHTMNRFTATSTCGRSCSCGHGASSDSSSAFLLQRTLDVLTETSRTPARWLCSPLPPLDAQCCRPILGPAAGRGPATVSNRLLVLDGPPRQGEPACLPRRRPRRAVTAHVADLLLAARRRGRAGRLALRRRHRRRPTDRRGALATCASAPPSQSVIAAVALPGKVRHDGPAWHRPA